MKNYVPWNWIVTSFVLAVFGIITFWALCSSIHNRGGSNITNLQDSIIEKNEYITNLQDTLEQKDREIQDLQQALTKRNNRNSEKRTLNALDEKIKEKDRIIRNKDAEIKRLKEKIEFINSL